MAKPRGKRDKNYDTRSSEWIGDLAVWKNLNAETNNEQLARLKKNLTLAIQNELTPHQQRYLQMHYFEGLSCTEIAAALGVSASTVSRTITRAKARLQKVLKYTF